MFFRKILNNLSYQNRLKKYNLFIRIFNPKADTKILDVGASDIELQDYANLLEKRYPYPENITALGIESYEKEFSKRYPKVRTVTYDAEKFPFSDKEFDLCWSSAVLEHVGGRDKQVNFLREISRVSKSCFITTPNRYFPIEVHTRVLFLHYLPKKLFDAVLKKTGKGWASGNYMHPLGLRDLKKLLVVSGIKNYRILKNRKFGFTIDFIILM